MRDFNEDFYIKAYPDVQLSGIDPLAHFQRIGIRLGRLPNRSEPNLNSPSQIPTALNSMPHSGDGTASKTVQLIELFKLDLHPEPRKRTRISHHLHRNADEIYSFLSQFSDQELGTSSENRYLRIMEYLTKSTHLIDDFPLIDRRLYYLMYPDLEQSEIDPFIHYINFGKLEKRNPHPLLNHNYYTSNYPETAHFKFSVLFHFIKFGSSKGYNPSEFFNTSYYQRRYPDVKASKINPLIHFLRYPGCMPNENFDSKVYAEQNPSLIDIHLNPLVHFIYFGKGNDIPTKRDSEILLTANYAPSATPQAESLGYLANGKSAYNVLPAPRIPLIVMVDAFFPCPDQDSGSLDQYNYAQIFQTLGYEVAFASLIEFHQNSNNSLPMKNLGVHCITAEQYINIEEFIFLNADRIAGFFLSRFNFGGTLIAIARSFCPRSKIIFNTVDLHHIREERQAKVSGDSAMLENSVVTKTKELDCISSADISIVVSKTEASLLNKLCPSSKIKVIPLIRSFSQRLRPAFAARGGVAFIGGFNHAPNLDAVTNFLETIWPKILKMVPTMKLYVIGSNLPKSLQSNNTPNVEWVGYVPSLETRLDKLRLTIAPLRFGAGAKGKIVSSLSNGVPCVASEIAAEGMDIAEGFGITVAENASDFAEKVIRLHNDETWWNEMSERGFNATQQTYSIDNGIKLVEQIFPKIN